MENVIGSAPEAPSKPLPSPKLPIVFDYLDYRKFLADWLSFKKAVQPHYSSTIFSRKAGINSHSLLGMVIRAERNLSAETSRGFTRALELKGASAVFFERLVFFSQAKRAEDKFHYLQQMHDSLPSKAPGGTVLHQLIDYSDYLCSIENVLVRELVVLDDFQADAEWICRRLRRRFPKNRCERAWSLLVRLGMVKQNDQGRWEQTDPNLLIESAVRVPALVRFYTDFFTFAGESIQKEPMDTRDLGTLTISLPAADIPLLKKKLQDFRRELHQMFPVSKGPREEVVVVGLQMFQTTTQIEASSPKEGESK